MKLLRDFFRFRTADRSSLGGRRDTSNRTWTITVPQPLVTPTPSAVIDMHWDADAARGRPVAHWHEHDARKSNGHLELISSH
ncbi:hypothetical protein [Dyella psychrodurans]|uniref:Uncharacterized protein n=1 Tax=Dyella psychrodurans TaxID=1927960 RepID=A0A370X6C6_9GAMM|nr:hypothetical protein [Dyella psychrodurans]RDS83983.1 hypothetical protein DWU99_09355 [Dyella psychrodurans]